MPEQARKYLRPHTINLNRSVKYLILLIMALGLPSRGADTNRFLDPVSLTGSIYPRNSSNSPALFTFQRSAHAEGDTIVAVRTYSAPDMTVAARESVEYETNRLKRVVLEELQTESHGSATFEEAGEGKTVIHFEYQSGSKHTRTATETQTEPILINDTLPSFISQNWGSLTNGQTLPFRYAIIPRLETIGFTLRQTGQRDTAHGNVIELEMAPGNWLLRKLVVPIQFTVERGPLHRILEYTGRTTPKVKNGRNWEDLDATTRFNWPR